MLGLHLSSQIVIQWLSHYGSFALFFLLALGIFGLPIPDETLLVLTGLLIAKHQLSFITIPVAYLGSIFGITLSYILGYTAGRKILKRYGYWVGINEEKLKKAHQWFEKLGKWLLLVGFYIPGIRHLNGIIAGTTYLTYWEFALFAYIGAIIWCSIFIIIGYFGFQTWHHVHAV